MPPFEKNHTVAPAEIDELGHVNNIVYLHWVNDMAIAHSASCGWPFERYTKLGAGWAVRKHEVEYLLPAHKGDELVLRTWIAAVSRSTSMRRFEVFRPKDGKVLAKAVTLWVWINYATGRLERVPPEASNCYELIPDPPQPA